MRLSWILVLNLFLQMFWGRAFAASALSVLDLGLAFYQQETASGLISQTGYFLRMQVEARENWFRPTYGATIEFSSASNRVFSGNMIGGVEIIGHKAPIFKPFVSFNADLGWASYANSDGTYNGILYGFVLSAGGEFRFKDADNASGLRLTSSYRYLVGTIGGGLSGSDLSVVMISFGYVF